MLKDELKNDFKNDVAFSGWTDSLGVQCDRRLGYGRVVAEVKDINSNKKICVVLANGIRIRFMQGNKILQDLFWSRAVEDAAFENKVGDFLNFPFADCRKAFRSIMYIIAKTL
jgi:hypothetical protein